MTIRWCKELKYLQTELPVDTADAASEFKSTSNACYMLFAYYKKGVSGFLVDLKKKKK